VPTSTTEDSGLEAYAEPRQQNAVTLTPAAQVNAIAPPPEPHAATRGDMARRASNGRNMLLSQHIPGYPFDTLRTRSKNLISAFDHAGICPGCAQYNTWDPRYMKLDPIHRNTVARVGGSDVPTHCCLNCCNRDSVGNRYEQLKEPGHMLPTFIRTRSSALKSLCKWVGCTQMSTSNMTGLRTGDPEVGRLTQGAVDLGPGITKIGHRAILRRE